jgi:hypothetical protein
VAGKNDIIEAHARSGVTVDHVSKYFEDTQCQVFFRKPKGWNRQLGEDIVYTAAGEVGTKYDLPLIVAHMFQALLIGRLLNKISRGRLDRIVSRTLNHPKRWICSELVAHCLQEQESLRDLGILKTPACQIDPQELFEDGDAFEPWKHSQNTQGDNFQN